jgi:hypothetical protein
VLDVSFACASAAKGAAIAKRTARPAAVRFFDEVCISPIYAYRSAVGEPIAARSGGSACGTYAIPSRKAHKHRKTEMRRWVETPQRLFLKRF